MKHYSAVMGCFKTFLSSQAPIFKFLSQLFNFSCSRTIEMRFCARSGVSKHDAKHDILCPLQVAILTVVLLWIKTSGSDPNHLKREITILVSLDFIRQKYSNC